MLKCRAVLPIKFVNTHRKVCRQDTAGDLYDLETYPKDQFWMLGRLQTTRLGDVFDTNVSLQCVRVCLAVRSDAPYIMFAILGTAPATRNVCPNTQKHTDDRKTPGVQENSDGQSRLTVLVNSPQKIQKSGRVGLDRRQVGPSWLRLALERAPDLLCSLAR